MSHLVHRTLSNTAIVACFLLVFIMFFTASPGALEAPDGSAGDGSHGNPWYSSNALLYSVLILLGLLCACMLALTVCYFRLKRRTAGKSYLIPNSPSSAHSGGGTILGSSFTTDTEGDHSSISSPAQSVRSYRSLTHPSPTHSMRSYKSYRSAGPGPGKAVPICNGQNGVATSPRNHPINKHVYDNVGAILY